MESPTPMDRLLCGDVGYGKTEVAMRAAFKAVMDGKQVAFLAPTTVLAFQHQKTLRSASPASRFGSTWSAASARRRSRKETITDLAAGKVDIIVGTHRLLSKDVEFRDLGLLVVDEEQRFGVAHKEKIKQLKKKVDVLTMSATPIPRTLNMSLVGIRDMSIIETPPKDRLSIQTNVVKFDQAVIGRAIRNELQRGGQVYFVHNRVESIFSIGNLIQRLVPEARVVVGHGQMDEEQLEHAMLDFVARKFDILLATTIVENGLDIPNANTIIINRADHYGLSQLYQLRGRVGRSDRPAYAYLLIPPEDNLSPVAKKRLAAIKKFSDLGSGFRVAALDSRSAAPATCSAANRAVRSTRSASSVHEAARADRPRAEGAKRSKTTCAQRSTCASTCARRDVCARYEPAADALPQSRRGAYRSRDRSRARGGADRYGPPPIPCSTWRLRPHPRDGRSAGHRQPSTARPYRRLKVQTAGEGRSRAARSAGAAAARAHARPACGPQAESWMGWGSAPADRARPATSPSPSPRSKKRGDRQAAPSGGWRGPGRASSSRFHQGRDPRPPRRPPRPAGVRARGRLLSDCSIKGKISSGIYEIKTFSRWSRRGRPPRAARSSSRSS
jgi:superfamily II DNA or RNA helicase